MGQAYLAELHVEKDLLAAQSAMALDLKRAGLLFGKSIGVGRTGYPVPPPSEPYVRISRIRLSGRSFYLRED
jgi:hypothetical protein